MVRIGIANFRTSDAFLARSAIYGYRVRSKNLVASADLLAAAGAIRRGATSLASRARVERRGELSLNQTAVLGLLSRGHALTPTEIAERMHITLQSLTRTLSALRDEGSVTRMPDPSDRRRSKIAITEAGRAWLREEMRPRDEWLARVIESELTEVECELLVIAAELMERISEIDLFPDGEER